MLFQILLRLLIERLYSRMGPIHKEGRKRTITRRARFDKEKEIERRPQVVSLFSPSIIAHINSFVLQITVNNLNTEKPENETVRNVKNVSDETKPIPQYILTMYP